VKRRVTGPSFDSWILVLMSIAITHEPTSIRLNLEVLRMDRLLCYFTSFSHSAASDCLFSMFYAEVGGDRELNEQWPLSFLRKTLSTECLL
jgi:hypothetical protein